MAEEAQRFVHVVKGADEPLGWDNQLRPRLGVQMSYMYTRRWRGFASADWAGVHGYLRATVGNTKTLGAVGLTLVAGERDRVFGAPDEGDFLAVDFNDRKNYFHGVLSGWTFYLQGQLAAVAHNYFITGTTFGEQSQVELKHNVWMTTLGASWRISPAYRIEYAFKRRSPEFTAPGPRPDDRYQRYGEIRFVSDLDF